MKGLGNKPVWGTILHGLAFGLLFIPAVRVLAVVAGYKTALQLIVFMFIAGYAWRMAGWAGRSPLAVVFPLLVPPSLLFFGAPLKPFVFLCVVVFAWIRSGILFRASPVTTALAEGVLSVGTAAAIGVYNPATQAAWALSGWLFFLVQSVYFILFAGAEKTEPAAMDTFETARRRLEDILSAESPAE